MSGIPGSYPHFHPEGIMEVEGRQLPHGPPTPHTPSTRRLSADSVNPSRTTSMDERHSSQVTTPLSDSVFHTPDPGSSALSLPPLTSPRHHDEFNEADPRDSGIDTITPMSRISSHFSQSLPNIAAPVPVHEDRPDLWRSNYEALTFLPHTQGGDPTPQLRDIRRQAGTENTVDSPVHPQPRRRGVRRMFAALGYGTGNRYRKESVGLIWNLCFGFIQVAVTLALIIYSSVHRSPRQPSISEWKACNKPLGLWSCFWIIKVVLDCCMTYWGWRRDWKNRRPGQNTREGDAERGASTVDAIPQADSPNQDTPAIIPVDRQRRRLEASSPHSRLYSRFSLLLSLTIISWFITANIFVFTSLDSCRFAGPHLWWLAFSLLCLQYLVVLEVVATAMIVFIIGPLIYLFWSIILICLGRHPIQNPYYISPEIGKASRSVVDQIPLVLYIPSPPGDGKDGGITGTANVTIPRTTGTSMADTEQNHTYPPKQPAPPKRRFVFLSRKSSKPAPEPKSAEKKAVIDEHTTTVWEDCWESGEYPFVRLEPNRASCAICLLDFEEPKRRVAREVIRSWAENNRKMEADTTEGKSERFNEKEETSADGAAGASSSNQASSPSVEPSARRTASFGSSSQSSASLRLADAGEGAQPLRLLHCGHAFHKTCIDPWLTDVSGRCPTCQRPVHPKDPPEKPRNRNRSGPSQ